MNKLIFIFFIFLFLVACINNEPDKEKLFLEARDKQQNGQLDSALFIYNNILTIDSSYSKAYIGIGLINAEKGDYRSAIENTKKAITFEPTGIAFFYLGGYYMGLNKFDSAKVWMKKALEHNPHDKLSKVYLGEICGALNEFDTALVIFNELISIDSNSPDGFAGRAGIYARMNMHDKEIEDFKKAIELDTAGKTQALVNIAYTYHYAMKDNIKACEYIKLAEKKIGYKPTNKELSDFCGELVP